MTEKELLSEIQNLKAKVTILERELSILRRKLFDLPVETLIRITDYLTYEEIINLTMVNRTLYNIIYKYLNMKRSVQKIAFCEPYAPYNIKASFRIKAYIEIDKSIHIKYENTTIEYMAEIFKKYANNSKFIEGRNPMTLDRFFERILDIKDPIFMNHSKTQSK